MVSWWLSTRSPAYNIVQFTDGKEFDSQPSLLANSMLFDMAIA